MLPCSFFLRAWVNCGSGGIPAPTCVFCLLFLSSYHSAFCWPLSHSSAHTRTCCIQLLSSSFWRSLMHLLSCWIVCMITSLPFVRSFLSHIRLHAVSSWPRSRERGCLCRCVCVCAVVGVTRCPDDIKQYFFLLPWPPRQKQAALRSEV